MTEEVKLPPIPTEWIGMLGARMVTHEEAQAYARQAVLEDRKRQAAVLTPVPRQKRPKALAPEQLGNLLSATRDLGKG